ncbi:MAG TPA: gliding motility-associated ABC transporter substrate-binding protein GldG [Bacteroidia bacterium]|jgi:ABC-2 type transport system permease protein|nr:gliding motility-associated ABC transporter substrate-binding protein GldG [Bacteroidia bacterium]
MVSEKKHTTSNKRKDISNFVMTAAIVILANFVFSFYFKRFDLTSEKRYTLAESTRKLLKGLDDVVFLKVYLGGDLNPDFTRLKNETKEILDEFRAYSDNQIEYEFINPGENPNKEEVDKIEKQLYDKGIIPEQIIDKSKKNQKVTETIIWPGAIVTYKGREVPWQIFKRQTGGGFTNEVSINNSVQDLEYGITNTIRKLRAPRKPEVTFIEGHSELDTLRQYDFMRSLGEYYNVSRITLDQKLGALKGTDVIVITKPDSSFVEKDKFIIDQFIMNGGKVLWMIDPVILDMDTFRLRQFTLGFSNDLNLEDMLFKYGVRLNPVLVQDMQCANIPVNVGFKNGQPNFKPFPWLYNVLIMPDIDHPIVKNLDLIRSEFASTIDTVSARGIKKTVLLHTSRFTKAQPTPARVALAMVQFKPKEIQFNNPYQIVACLLEGEFNSNYANRLPTAILRDSSIAFKDHGKKTKMIVIADGDISKNEVRRSTGPLPLGYDAFTNQTYANKTFLINCVNYLLDDEGLLQLRAREIKLRLLDKKKYEGKESKWQLINIALPLGLVIAFGMLQFYIRKKKYAS